MKYFKRGDKVYRRRPAETASGIVGYTRECGEVVDDTFVYQDKLWTAVVWELCGKDPVITGEDWDMEISQV